MDVLADFQLKMLSFIWEMLALPCGENTGRTLYLSVATMTCGGMTVCARPVFGLCELFVKSEFDILPELHVSCSCRLPWNPSAAAANLDFASTILQDLISDHRL